MMWIVAFRVLASIHFCIYLLLITYGSIASVLRRRRSQPKAAAKGVGMSALKALKGIDPELEENLESFAALATERAFEVILAVDDEHDAAYPLARRCAERHPATVKVVVGTTPGMSNPKIASLELARTAAKYELLWISDSNVRATQLHFDSMLDAWEATQLQGRKAALVHAPVSSDCGSGIGARMDRLHFTTYNNFTYEASLVGGVHVVIGKSLLIHRDDLAKMGGFARFGNTSGEDFQMGDTMRHIGVVAYSRIASRQILPQHWGWRAFYARQKRWARLRCNMLKWSFYFGEPFTHLSIVLIFTGFGLLPWTWGASAVALRIVTDALLLKAHLGASPRISDALLLLPKEFTFFAACLAGSRGGTIQWRGRTIGFSKSGGFAGVVSVHQEPNRNKST